MMPAGASAEAGGTLVSVGASVTPTKHFSDPRHIWPEHLGYTKTIRYGPFTVPAASMDEPGMLRNQVARNLPTPCSKCYITDIVPSLVYANGTNASFETGTMLHHFVLFNQSAQDVTCTKGLIAVGGQRFFASGNERSEVHFPDGYGYWNQGHDWTLDADLMNMMPEPQEVYVQVVVRYRWPHSHLKKVTPIWLDVNNCDSSEYSIPTGYSDTTWDWTSTLTGYIIGIGGHQHDLSAMEMECMEAEMCPEHGGGIAISAELVGGQQSEYYGPQPPTGGVPEGLTGGTICRSEDRYFTPFGMENGYMGHLDTMTGCGLYDKSVAGNDAYPPGGEYKGQGFPIKAGDTIRLHSQYWDPGEPHDDVMGIMMAYLYEAPVN
jgi:hypothetical protein